MSELLQNKTSLETFAENLFETAHFNKKPKQIKSLYRPDFMLAPHLFVNVDGLYWHSDLQKDKRYHFNLRQEFEKNALRIFQFREDEVYNKTNIVKSMIANALQKTPQRIYARKTICKSVSHKEADKFLVDNHLMGTTKAKHIGLFNEEGLVSVLSYKQYKNVCKIERFCSTTGTTVVGGFSKLLAHLKRNCLKPTTTEIPNWVALRYGTGTHLSTKGFVQSKETLGWKWTDGTRTFNRLKCRANMDERKLSEKEHAKELGWFRIYDAGQRLWICKIK